MLIVNNYLKKNIEKIIITFLLLQPLIDIFTTLSMNIFKSGVTFGLVIRGFFLLILLYYVLFSPDIKKNKKLVVVFTLLFYYAALYLLNILILKGFPVLFLELKYFIKTFYFPITLLCLYTIYSSSKDKLIIKSSIFSILTLTYIGFILLPILTGSSLASYGGIKTGTTGWFYAGNEIGSIIAILLPLLLIHFFKHKKIISSHIVTFLSIYIALIIGTKVPFLGLLFLLIYFVFYFSISFFFTKNKINKRLLLTPIITGIIIFLLILPTSNAGTNLSIHINLIGESQLIETIERKLGINFGKKPVEKDPDSKENDNPTVPSIPHKYEPSNLIFSSRNVYLLNTKKDYDNSSLLVKFIGMGFINNYGSSDQNLKAIEMDFHEIFYRYGVIGFIVYFSIPLFLLALIFKKTFLNFKRVIKDSYFITLLFSLVLGLGIAFIAGHVLTAPSVSIYLSVIMIVLYFKPLNETKDANNKIWIDITNSPHSILFNPIIKKLKKSGYDITVTARDYAQTIGLLNMFGIEYKLIGDHKGKNKFKKIWGLFQRSWQLYWFAYNKNFAASLSMSSQTAMITSRILGIPHMTLFDYEYTAGHHINFRLSQRILAPLGVEKKVMRRHGATKKKIVFYPGLKEQFYIHYYMKEYNKKYKDSNPLKKQFNISDNQILIVLRPEATVAHYQTNKNDLIFDLVEYLSKSPKKPIIIVLPRIKGQKEQYKAKNYKNVIIPEEAINGIDLVASADLVIGAGGTVNREAAAVGTPAYSLFGGGQFGAVDRMLFETKRMIKIETKKDFKKIKIEKKKNKPMPIGEDYSDWYVELVKDLIELKAKDRIS